MAVLNQSESFAKGYGDVVRSSAIFYYRENPKFRTTLSFMNYWKYKRGFEVGIIASIRDMSGRLFRRERLDFHNANVLNYRLPSDGFEGSVEIEVFSAHNLVVPYAAITAIYETDLGVSQVHSYSRAYSPHEIEEGCLTDGEEGCWTLRDSGTIRSWAVFHNGPLAVPAQDVALRVINSHSEQDGKFIHLPDLAPFQSVKIVPSEHLDLATFLGGRCGWANISFKTGGSFTRMLVANETPDDFQVTHSNFNYSRHRTDRIEATAYKRIPSLGLLGKQVIVYPDREPGDYEIRCGADRYTVYKGPAVLDVGAGLMAFTKLNGMMPTRLVSALTWGNGRTLPFETSLGVVTKLQPRKRFWWGCVDAESLLIIHDMPEIYGGMTGESIEVSLYSARDAQVRTAKVDAVDSRFDTGMPIAALFPDAATFLGQDFGYYSVYSDYGGLTCYSLMEKETGSKSFEHGF